MGKFSRDKGKRYEQELGREYRAHGFDVSRNSNQAHLAHVAVDPKGDLLGVEGIHIQAKDQERLNIWEAMRQAEEEAPEGWIPAVHYKRNRVRPWVSIPLEDWFRLLEEARR